MRSPVYQWGAVIVSQYYDDTCTETCEWLHQRLNELPLVRFPFELGDLPENGVYFFYEEGETWGHGGNEARITRIGTSREGNFRSRIAEHYLLNESKMNFDINRPAPHERSIFRKNIGRALLNRQKDDYIKVWELDFTSREKREAFSHLRNIQKELTLESNITKLLRSSFSFRYIILDSQEKRMGTGGIESSLIGTVARCSLCRPSPNWLGNYSPDSRIRQSGLWLVQHLRARPLSDADREMVVDAIKQTQRWVNLNNGI